MSSFSANIWCVDGFLSYKFKKLSLHQIDFFNSRYSSRNSQRSKLAECKTCL